MKKLKKILLINDDEITNYVSKALLEDLEVTQEIDVVTNGECGLEYLLKNCEMPGKICPQLVILDDQMPEMGGLELMKALDAINFNHDIVFLLIGINTREEGMKEFRELGVQEITYKPISKESVMRAYHRYWIEQEIKSMNEKAEKDPSD